MTTEELRTSMNVNFESNFCEPAVKIDHSRCKGSYAND